MTKKSVLITVGTTSFQPLIIHTDTPSFTQLLARHGYTDLVYQIGRGHHIPKHGQHFRVTPHINSYYEKADLMISHGGAGTLLQNLVNGKLIIAVVNEELLGNHQLELVEMLAKEGYILGFESIEEFRKGQEKIEKFLREGSKRKYQRPEECVMNEIVFGKGKGQ